MHTYESVTRTGAVISRGQTRITCYDIVIDLCARHVIPYTYVLMVNGRRKHWPDEVYATLELFKQTIVHVDLQYLLKVPSERNTQIVDIIKYIIIIFF